jgi:hypothetical protein
MERPKPRVYAPTKEVVDKDIFALSRRTKRLVKAKAHKQPKNPRKRRR